MTSHNRIPFHNCSNKKIEKFYIKRAVLSKIEKVWDFLH